jgi:hypothetical protein
LFLLLVSIVEGVENYQAMLRIYNTLFSNLSTMIELTFYLYVFLEIVYAPLAKKVFLYFLVMYPLIGLINIFFFQRGGFHTITYALGCLLIIICCVYYFLELFQRPSSVNLGRQPAFWICSGLLFYYTCTFPLYGAINMLKLFPRVILSNLLYILVLLNILLYLSFTIAFLCRLKTRRSMS